jgi:hypothetical protein
MEWKDEFEIWQFRFDHNNNLSSTFLTDYFEMQKWEAVLCIAAFRDAEPNPNNVKNGIDSDKHAVDIKRSQYGGFYCADDAEEALLYSTPIYPWQKKWYQKDFVMSMISCKFYVLNK